MRLVFFCSFFILLTLSACGGGGGGDSSKETNIIPPIKEDPLKAYIEVKNAYQGSTNQAFLNRSNLVNFYEYLFFLVPELLPEYVDEIDTGFGLSCSGGGEVEVGDLIDNEKLIITFNDCVEDDSKINGQVTARIKQISSAGEVISSQFIFEDVDFLTKFASGKLKGTMLVDDLELGCPTSRTEYDFLITEDDGHQVYFSDFYIYRRGDVGILCGDDGIRGAGEIYDSELGYVEFKIIEDFKLETMTYNNLEQGKLELRGSNNSLSTFSINNYQENGKNDSYYKINLQSDEQESFEFIFLNDYFSSELLSSFADTDGDGIGDVLENILGFNFNDPTDAYLDFDGDGYSNIEEITYFGHPLDDEIKPKIADVTVELSHEVSAYSSKIPLNVLISNQSIDVNASGIEVVIFVAEPMVFTDINMNQYPECYISNDYTIVTCNRNESLNSSELYSFYLDAPAENIDFISAEVKAQISFAGHDPDLTNNNQNININRNKLKVDYSIRETDRKDSIAILKGDTKEFEYSIQPIQSSQDENGNWTLFDLFTDNLKVDLLVPSLGKITSASCYQSDNQEWVDCLDGSSVILDPNSLMFRFTFIGEALGKGVIPIQVKSELTGENVLKVWDLPVIVGESSDLIQNKIDAAAHGDVINVEPNIYIGKLDLSTKKVTLQAESTDTSLIFVFDGFSFEGPSIRLGYDSSLVGFTLASHVIHVEDTGGNILKNNFGIAEHYFSGVNITSYGDFRFDQNIISARGVEPIFDHTTSDYSKGCVSINIENNKSTINTTVISNTLYKGNKLYHSDVSFPCDFVDYFGGTLQMKNNTFIEMGEPLRVFASYQNDIADYTLLYSNNITVSSRRMIYNDLSQSNFDYGYTFSSSVENNLVHNMLLDSWDPKGLLNETGLIDSDPKFNSEFSLSSNSPAIDAGLNNGVLIDLNDKARPSDGNGDGVAEHDLGAFEFIPPN